jgi:uncharacterized tellurite resistance protein B-like protein
MVIHKSFKDFVLFLYVHMSRADESYDPHELATIKKKMEGLFTSGTDVERKLYTTIREYNSFDQSMLSGLFEATFKHFDQDTSVMKNNFYKDLNEIMMADGKVDDAETKALKALQGIIDLNAERKIVT